MENARELTAARHGQRVLIVDDDQDLARSMGELIGSFGCQAEVVATPAETHRMLETFRPSVVLIDVRLGKYSGIDLLAEVVKYPAAPICIMITGYASTGTAVETLTAGAYDYLTKPVTPDNLFATLDRCFDRIRLDNERADALSKLESRNRELEQVNKRLHQVVECMGSVTSCTSVTSLSQLLLEKVASNMGAEGGSVYIREGDQLILAHSLDPGHAPPVIPMPLNPDSVLGRIMNRAESVMVSNAASSEGLMLSGWSGYRDESLLALPLVGQAGEAIGVLSLHTKKQPPFTQQDRDIGRILLAVSCETLRALQAIEELRKSQSMLQLIIDSEPECVKVLDRDRKLLQMNPAGLAMLEADSIDQVSGCCVDGIIEPEYREAFQEMSDEVFRGNPGKLEFKITGLRGTERWLEIHAVPLRDGGQEIIGLLGVTRDVTDRRKAESELAESRNMLKLIIDSEPECVKVLDRDRKLLQMNPAGLAMLEADSIDQVSGCCVDGIVEPEYREAFREMSDEVFRGNTGELEFKIAGLRGTERWLEAHAVPLRDGGEEVIGMLCLTRDITDKRQTDIELDESRTMLQLIIDAVPECVKVVDKDGNVLQMNRAGVDILEADSIDKILGETIYPMVSPEYRDALQKLDEQASKEALSGRLEFELTTFQKNKIWLETHTVPLRNASKEVIGVLAVTRDITESRDLTEKARQQELQLMQASKMASMGTLVAGVAHEINNPNQTIQINSGLVSRVWEDATRLLDQHAIANGEFNLAGLPFSEVKTVYTGMIQDINDAAKQIKVVVERLRDFARPYDGASVRKQGTSVQLNEAVETAVALLRHSINKRSGAFHCELAANLPPIIGIQQHLQQIVINLVLNALEALSDKSCGIRVETRLHDDGSCVDLLVSDEGVGISPDVMEQIMEPFFTTKRDTGGTGLGLSITHSLVQDLCGTLRFESEPGSGTLAIASFPVFNADQDGVTLQ